MRHATDEEMMRQRARIVTKLQMAFPGAAVDVTGVADAATNRPFGWLLQVKKGKRAAEHTLSPDATVQSAIDALRARMGGR